MPSAPRAAARSTRHGPRRGQNRDQYTILFHKGYSGFPRVKEHPYKRLNLWNVFHSPRPWKHL